MIYSPLEQFRIFPLFSFDIFYIDLSFTNSSLIILLALGSFLFITNLFLSPNIYLLQSSGTFFVPNNRWFLILEYIYLGISNLIFDNLGLKGQQYFPFLFVLFVFVLVLNLIGLIPYSFTATSHLIVTFSLALIVFLGICIIGIKIHKINLLSLFFPKGTALILALLLVPLEIISFIFKPISLSVRLFANMMAGHTLLKVIAGFGWTMMKTKSSSLLFLAHFLPLFFLIILVGLELAVAFIQAYVFTILSCIYLNDCINLH